MSETARLISLCVVFILLFVALAISAVPTNRVVVSRRDIGTVDWIEPLQAVDSGFIPSVDAQGQISQTVSIDMESAAVIGTAAGRWVVEGKTRFAKGDTLVLAVMKSGRRYLCRTKDTARKHCSRVKRGPTR